MPLNGCMLTIARFVLYVLSLAYIFALVLNLFFYFCFFHYLMYFFCKLKKVKSVNSITIFLFIHFFVFHWKLRNRLVSHLHYRKWKKFTSSSICISVLFELSEKQKIINLYTFVNHESKLFIFSSSSFSMKFFLLFFCWF